MSIVGGAGRTVPLDGALRASLRSPASPSQRMDVQPFSVAVCDESVLLQRGDITVAIDARLDYTAELKRALDLPDATGDAELTLQAYVRWGEACFERIEGDFAVAVWDARDRTLWLARDSSGTRPLHFMEYADGLLFASEPRSLLAARGTRAKVNEQYVAEWLSGTFGGSRNTPFAGIYRLPQANLLCYRNGVVAIRRWWKPERVPVQRNADPRVYAEGMLHHMRAAVAARIPCTGGVGSHLSSGFDSSTVTALAARQLASEQRGLTAFTAVPETAPPTVPTRNGDEGPIAAQTAAMYPNIQHVRIRNNLLPILPTLDIYSDATATPQLNAGNCVWVYSIVQEAAQRGVKVLLNGINGNLTLSYAGASTLTEMIASGRFIAAGKLIQQQRRRGIRLQSALNMAFTPFFPPTFLSAVQRWRGRESSYADFSGLRPAFAYQHGITPAQLSTFSLPRRNGRQLRIKIVEMLDMGMTYAADRRLFGVTSTDPTGDRRVMEYSLSVPEEAYCAEGVPRAIVRRAMQGQLPDAVLNPVKRGLQYADLFAQLTREREELAEELHYMGQHDLLRRAVDVESLQRLVEHWPVGETYPSNWSAYCIRLTRAISLGRFVRRFEL